jgi:hypothetical protein
MDNRKHISVAGSIGQVKKVMFNLYITTADLSTALEQWDPNNKLLEKAEDILNDTYSPGNEARTDKEQANDCGFTLATCPYEREGGITVSRAELDEFREWKAGRPKAPAGLVEEAVSRLLSWKLPKDFSPDGGVLFYSPYAPGSPSWPTGTNLLTATQAKQMFEYCLAIDTSKIDREVGALHKVRRELCDVCCKKSCSGCKIGHAFDRHGIKRTTTPPRPAEGKEAKP